MDNIIRPQPGCYYQTHYTPAKAYVGYSQVCLKENKYFYIGHITHGNGNITPMKWDDCGISFIQDFRLIKEITREKYLKG